MATKKDEKSTAGKESSETKTITSNKSWAQESYESFWLYRENHPWRLGQHIALRGVFAGSTLALVGGFGFALVRRRGTLLTSVGKITFRGATIGGLLMGAVAAERCFRLDPVGVEDRAYRISYNWGQTKWDWIALEGAIIGGILLKKPFGGVLPAASVGIGMATLACAGFMMFAKFA